MPCHAVFAGACNTDPELKFVPANLEGADLRQANLSCAELWMGRLAGADLRGADLIEAELTGADLTGADLRYAIFVNAEMCSVDLRGANLEGTDFFGATLHGAKLDPDIEAAIRLGDERFCEADIVFKEDPNPTVESYIRLGGDDV